MMVIGQYTPTTMLCCHGPLALPTLTCGRMPTCTAKSTMAHRLAQAGRRRSTSPIFAHFDSPNGAYKMGFFAQTVDWMARPVALAGESVVVMQVDGMVRNSTGADWGLWLCHSALSASAWAT